jgi:hypothetical protein
MCKLEDEILKIAKITDAKDDFEFVEKDERHRKAIEFLNKLDKEEASADKSYTWTADYARQLWDGGVKIFSTIDEKADSIIKYLGGGTGIFALGIIAKIDSHNYYLAWLCAPSILCSLLAIYLAICARRPRGVPSLPPISQAFKFAEDYQNPTSAQRAFLGHWNLACIDMDLVCTRKAHLLEVAMKFYFAALGFLILPLLVAAAYPPGAAPS